MGRARRLDTTPSPASPASGICGGGGGGGVALGVAWSRTSPFGISSLMVPESGSLPLFFGAPAASSVHDQPASALPSLPSSVAWNGSVSCGLGGGGGGGEAP